MSSIISEDCFPDVSNSPEQNEMSNEKFENVDVLSLAPKENVCSTKPAFSIANLLTGKVNSTVSFDEENVNITFSFPKSEFGKITLAALKEIKGLSILAAEDSKVSEQVSYAKDLSSETFEAMDINRSAKKAVDAYDKILDFSVEDVIVQDASSVKEDSELNSFVCKTQNVAVKEAIPHKETEMHTSTSTAGINPILSSVTDSNTGIIKSTIIWYEKSNAKNTKCEIGNTFGKKDVKADLVKSGESNVLIGNNTCDTHNVTCATGLIPKDACDKASEKNLKKTARNGEIYANEVGANQDMHIEKQDFSESAPGLDNGIGSCDTTKTSKPSHTSFTGKSDSTTQGKDKDPSIENDSAGDVSSDDADRETNPLEDGKGLDSAKNNISIFRNESKSSDSNEVCDFASMLKSNLYKIPPFNRVEAIETTEIDFNTEKDYGIKYFKFEIAKESVFIKVSCKSGIAIEIVKCNNISEAQTDTLHESESSRLSDSELSDGEFNAVSDQEKFRLLSSTARILMDKTAKNSDISVNTDEYIPRDLPEYKSKEILGDALLNNESKDADIELVDQKTKELISADEKGDTSFSELQNENIRAINRELDDVPELIETSYERIDKLTGELYGDECMDRSLDNRHIFKPMDKLIGKQAKGPVDKSCTMTSNDEFSEKTLNDLPVKLSDKELSDPSEDEPREEPGNILQGDGIMNPWVCELMADEPVDKSTNIVPEDGIMDDSVCEIPDEKSCAVTKDELAERSVCELTDKLVDESVSELPEDEFLETLDDSLRELQNDECETELPEDDLVKAISELPEDEYAESLSELPKKKHTNGFTRKLPDNKTLDEPVNRLQEKEIEESVKELHEKETEIILKDNEPTEELRKIIVVEHYGKSTRQSKNDEIIKPSIPLSKYESREKEKDLANVPTAAITKTSKFILTFPEDDNESSNNLSNMEPDKECMKRLVSQTHSPSESLTYHSSLKMANISEQGIEEKGLKGLSKNKELNRKSLDLSESGPVEEISNILENIQSEEYGRGLSGSDPDKMSENNLSESDFAEKCSKKFTKFKADENRIDLPESEITEKLEKDLTESNDIEKYASDLPECENDFPECESAENIIGTISKIKAGDTRGVLERDSVSITSSIESETVEICQKDILKREPLVKCGNDRLEHETDEYTNIFSEYAASEVVVSDVVEIRQTEECSEESLKVRKLKCSGEWQGCPKENSANYISEEFASTLGKAKCILEVEELSIDCSVNTENDTVEKMLQKSPLGKAEMQSNVESIYQEFDLDKDMNFEDNGSAKELRPELTKNETKPNCGNPIEKVEVVLTTDTSVNVKTSEDDTTNVKINLVDCSENKTDAYNSDEESKLDFSRNMSNVSDTSGRILNISSSPETNVDYAGEESEEDYELYEVGKKNRTRDEIKHASSDSEAVASAKNPEQSYKRKAKMTPTSDKNIDTDSNSSLDCKTSGSIDLSAFQKLDKYTVQNRVGTHAISKTDSDSESNQSEENMSLKAKQNLKNDSDSESVKSEENVVKNRQSKSKTAKKLDSKGVWKKMQISSKVDQTKTGSKVSNSKTPDDVDSAPIRQRYKMFQASTLAKEVIPENAQFEDSTSRDVSNNNTLDINSSDSSANTTPIKRSLRSKSEEPPQKGFKCSKISTSFRRSSGDEKSENTSDVQSTTSRKKRSQTPDLKLQERVSVTARSSPRKTRAAIDRSQSVEKDTCSTPKKLNTRSKAQSTSEKSKNYSSSNTSASSTNATKRGKN